MAACNDAEDADDPWDLERAGRQGPLLDQLLSVTPQPTGLFVPTDEQTARLYPLLSGRGLRFGQEIAVISCDSQEFWLRQLDPRPPSIDLNFGLIGERPSNSFSCASAIRSILPELEFWFRQC